MPITKQSLYANWRDIYRVDIPHVAAAPTDRRRDRWSPVPLYNLPLEKGIEKFIPLFLSWFTTFTTDKLPFPFSEHHYTFIRWFGEILLSKEPFITKTCATQRHWAKTLLVKSFLLYLALYHDEIVDAGGSSPLYILYLSASVEKIKEEFADLKAKALSPEVIDVYGKQLLTAPGTGTTSTALNFMNGVRISGMVASLVRRGITHLGFKPVWIFTDDIETTATQKRPSITQEIREKLQRDAFSSMDTSRRRTMHITNYTSRTGNQQWLLDSTAKEDKMIVGLYNKDGSIAWPERYVESIEEAKKTGKESIELLRREFEKSPGGAAAFAAEMLCEPMDESLLTHRINLIRSHCEPKDPIRTVEIDRLTFNIYKEPVEGAVFHAGIDLSLGVGLDACTLVLAQHRLGITEIIIDAFHNRIGQDIFAVSLAKFLQEEGLRPMLVFDSLQGGGFRDAILKVYNNNLVYRDGKDNFGYRATTMNKSILVSRLRSELESGGLLNHSNALDSELMTHTSEDEHRQQSPLTATAHFDLLAAARMLCATLSEHARRPGLEEQGFYSTGKTELELHDPMTAGTMGAAYPLDRYPDA